MNIPPGADLREKQYRRETFLRFYLFHLKYRSHPAAGIYYVLPHLKRVLEWDDNRAIWYAFLEGNTHNPATSLYLLREATEDGVVYPEFIEKTWRREYERLAFDPDRRHQKRSLDKALWSYWTLLGTRGESFLTQDRFWRRTYELGGWDACWDAALQIETFGRLSAFSFLEYVRLAGVPLIAGSAYLADKGGSRTLRAGLRHVLGFIDEEADDFGKLWPEEAGHLNRAAGAVLWEAALRAKEAHASRRLSAEALADVGWFTMESALCTYRGWHTDHGRYPGVYNDLLYNALKKHERAFNDGFDTYKIWEARADALEPWMLLERNPWDPGYTKVKQSWYRETGQTVMMGREWPELLSQFDRRVDAQFYPRRSE